MDSSVRGWLFQDHDAPLIPPSWLGLWQVWGFDAVELARPRGGAKLAKMVGLDRAVEGICDAVGAFQPRFWSGAVCSEYVDDGSSLLGDLPLMSTTVDVLSKRHIGAGSDLALVAAMSREDLREHPMALLDLSMALESWWPNRERSPLWQALREESTLEDVALALIREYIAADGNRLDDAWVGYLQRRHSWGAPSATLQAIADEAGVTRERIRQIEIRVGQFKGLRKWPLPDVVADALEAVQLADFRDVRSAVVDAGLATDDDWTPSEVVHLLEWFGYSAAAAALEQRFDLVELESEAARQGLVEHVKAVRTARSASGLLQLTGVHLVDGTPLTREQVESALSAAYTRVFIVEGWALATIQRMSQLETAAAKQLGILSPLHAAELYEGLDRVRRQRQADPLPPVSVTLELLRHAGAITLQGEWVEGATLPNEEDSLGSWLVALLQGADGFVLHKEVINRAAIADARNLSSLGVYYLFNPCVRSTGHYAGLIRLVGAAPTPEQEAHASAVAKVTRVPTDVNWRATHDGMDLEVTVGSNLLGSGVLQPPKALIDQWPANGAAIACWCHREFKGRVSPSNGALVGLSALLVHHTLDHGLREGNLLVLRLEDEMLRAVPQ
ncbi:MAG: hypothetical protein F2840_06610 [Actinobacteria bacterium]|nr:hypothetical protein [Actinomycetota bacterium]